MEYNITTIDDKNLIKVSSSFAKRFNMEQQNVTILRFGLNVVETRIKVSENIDDHTVYVSKDVLKESKIPFLGNYHIKVVDKEIIFGPYIGIYLGISTRPLKWRYERLHSFVKNFSKTNGFICAFWDVDIDFEKLEVDAFCYDPINEIWKKRKVPFPSMVHRYGDIRKKQRDKLRGIYGDKFFNYNEMDKETEMVALSQKTQVSQFIPETQICDSQETFKRFLEKYNDIYFKPIRGRQGRNIHRIKKISEYNYLITISSKNTNEEIKLNSIAAVMEELQDKIQSNNYILQQTIDIEINNRVIDFRLRYEKNIENEWILSLFATRVSDPGGVVSNRSAGGNVFPPEKVLKEHYQYSDKQITKTKQRLINAGYKLIKAVEDSSVNYGKCAVDLGLDTEGNIWHIESNVIAPNDFTTRAFEGYAGLDRACQLNTEYSKRLAGFKDVKTKVSFDKTLKDQLYETTEKNYNVYITGRFRREPFAKTLKDYILNKEYKISKTSQRNTYLLININITEKELLKLIDELRNIDSNKQIKSILYEEKKCKRKKRRKISNSEKKLTIDNNRLNKEIKRLNKEIEQLKTSTSWKLSKPIRILGGLFKTNK